MAGPTLGLSVQSQQAVSAAADLDALAASATKAERGAQGVGRASREMAAAIGSVSAVLASIERNTSATAAAMERNQKATEAATRSYGQADLVMQRFIDRQTGVTRASAQWEGPLSNISEELDRMRARFNPLFAAQQRFEAATQEINRAQRLGAITADEATAAIMREQAAYDQLTASIQANSAAARAGSASRANNAHTTNLMFQAQDIAMMTAMGQAPLMLAMQQGSQVGPILQQMGSGRAAIAGIGTAIASLVSPINLITLGVIGFGAAGVQALMSMMNGTEDATSALEAHSKWLDEILVGYDAAREAAAGAVEQAMRLPQGSVESNLSAGRDSAIQAEIAAFEQLIAKQAELQERLNILSLGGPVFADIIGAAQPMADMALSLDMTNGELGAFHAELTRIANSNVDAEVRQWATDLLAYMDQARAARAETDSLGAALNALPGSINIDVAVRGLGVSDAIQQIANLTPELRTTREIINDIFEQEAGQARTTSELQALATAASDAMAALDEQDRRAEELRASRAATSTGGRAPDQWGAANDNFQQRIALQRLELSLLGQSTFEVERQRAAFELLNEARQAGVPITSDVMGQINGMANEYATVTSQIEQQNSALRQMEQLGGMVLGSVSSIADAWEDGKLELSEILDIVTSIGLQILQMPGANGGSFFSDLVSGAFGGMGGMPFAAPSAHIPGGFYPGLPGMGIRSWDGGGYTWSGPRSGGVDGKGGRLGILHPNETVIDHSRGQRSVNEYEGASVYREAAPVYVTIQTRDAESFRQSRAQVAADIGRAVALGRRVG